MTTTKPIPFPVTQAQWTAQVRATLAAAIVPTPILRKAAA